MSGQKTARRNGWRALVAIGLYGKALALGITRSQCVLRRPLLIMGFWTVVATVDAAWLAGTVLA